MAKVSAIDKRIAALEADIQMIEHSISVLRSVQKAKPVKPAKRKGYPAGMVVGEGSAAVPQPSGRLNA